MPQCLVFFVVAVLYWPRVWTQVLYAVLEWIFNYQNNGGRHGTGKMSTRTPHDFSAFCVLERREKGGGNPSLKFRKNKRATIKLQTFKNLGCSLCHEWSWREAYCVNLCPGWEESCCAGWCIWDVMIRSIYCFCCGWSEVCCLEILWCKKKKNKINAVLFMTFLFFSDHFMPCSWLWYLSRWQYSYVSMMSCYLLAFFFFPFCYSCAIQICTGL